MNIPQAGAHLDNMMRQTRMHHVHLSTMADMKANMLITLSSVLITLSAPHLGSPAFRLGGSALILCCLCTILLAIYAVKPKMAFSRKEKASLQLHNPSFNLLFFGDFTGLEYDEFKGMMEHMMNDTNLVYEMQLREVYILGQFLQKVKYRYVRLAYSSFLGGLLLSTALFLTEWCRTG